MTAAMSNGATSSIAISANIPAAGSNAVWSQSYPGASIIMETIPEEQESHAHSPRHATTSPTSRTEVHRKRETYKTEQVDTLVSTLPKDLIPCEWKNLPSEEIVSDPIMSSTYVTMIPGQTTSARSSRKTYVYESHVDDPDSSQLDNTASYSEDDNLERHSHSTQKVTRVTKITTTRSIKQVPVNPSDMFFDDTGNPTSNGYDGTSADFDDSDVGIDLSSSCVVEHEESHGMTPLKGHQLDQQPSTSATPSAPSKPDALLTEENDILLSWQAPSQSGTAGQVLGYLVEFRRTEKDPWEPAHDELLADNECRVSKLEDSNYSFRVSAANPAGFGPPSFSTEIPQLRDDSPGTPRILSADDRVLLEWTSPNTRAPLSGYLIEYRTPQSAWLPANDYPIGATRFEVVNLPQGDYEFRVIARYNDGHLSAPSLPTGFVKFKPDNQHKLQYNPDISRPGKPQVIASDTSWVRLRWQPSTSSDKKSLAYLVEVRETSDPSWFIVGEPISSNEFIADNLDSNTAYEFRVSSMALDGTQSMPSLHSDIIRLNAMQQNHYAELNNLNGTSQLQGQPPERPAACEYLDFDGGNSVTLCWLPAKSSLPVLGYRVEFRDLQQDPKSWYEVTENLVRSCKTTVGYLIHSHQYQFRIIAKNANGFSEPSDPSPLITIGSLLRDTKYLEAERHAAINLQDEFLRESPPLPDRDNSPPPMNRQQNMSALQYRDPTLREVIEYLKHHDENIVVDATGYLQHLTYNNDLIKEDTRQYGGIPLLIRLLQHRDSEIVRNACGSLKNLAFGRANDVNKKAINADGGVKALAQVIKTTSNVHVREEATGALGNISACDDLKEQVFHQVADVIVQFVVVPSSGLLRSLPADQAKHGTTTVFRNGTGILRNVSAASPETRKLLRVAPNLIEALLFFLRSAIQRNQVDNRAVENVVCILRNLSYRVQEVVDPRYDPRATPRSTRERSKSAPSFSPKNKKKSNGLFKKNKKDESPAINGNKVTGPSLLWHKDTVELYLRILQESADPEILEAAAASIQNLAACQFDGSIQVRNDVRTLKGLPVLVELLKLRDDKVVCSVVNALRNLCIDAKNLDLVGRHAMRDLVIKLPAPNQQARDPHISDTTIGGVLGIFWEVVRSNLDLTKLLHENGGTERLRSLAKAFPMYGKRVCKYATQILYLMWQHKEMQSVFQKSGLKDEDFYSGTIGRKGRSAMPSVDTTTLRRPISSMGNERPAHLRSETGDQSMDSVRYGQFDSPSTGRASSARFAEFSPVTPNSERSASAHPQQATNSPRHHNQSQEPVYAAVRKPNGNGNRRGSVDSWV